MEKKTYVKPQLKSEKIKLNHFIAESAIEVLVKEANYDEEFDDSKAEDNEMSLW